MAATGARASAGRSAFQAGSHQAASQAGSHQLSSRPATTAVRSAGAPAPGRLVTGGRSPRPSSSMLLPVAGPSGIANSRAHGPGPYQPESPVTSQALRSAAAWPVRETKQDRTSRNRSGPSNVTSPRPGLPARARRVRCWTGWDAIPSTRDVYVTCLRDMSTDTHPAPARLRIDQRHTVTLTIRVDRRSLCVSGTYE